MPYYPYLLVQKKNVWSDQKLYFFSLLSSLTRSCKNQIYLIWAATMQAYKIFYFSWNFFFGTFILVIPFHGNVVLLFRENFVCVLYLFLSLKTLRTTLLFLLFMYEILLPYFFKILSSTLSQLFQWRALESLSIIQKEFIKIEKLVRLIQEEFIKNWKADEYNTRRVYKKLKSWWV